MKKPLTDAEAYNRATNELLEVSERLPREKVLMFWTDMMEFCARHQRLLAEARESRIPKPESLHL